MDLPSLKGVCTALSSICCVPSGLQDSGDRFQSLMAQCIIMALGVSAMMSTYRYSGCGRFVMHQAGFTYADCGQPESQRVWFVSG